MLSISVYWEYIHEYSYLLQSGVDVAPQFTHSLPSEKYEKKIRNNNKCIKLFKFFKKLIFENFLVGNGKVLLLEFMKYFKVDDETFVLFRQKI
jgi:hypothetical protein